MILAVVFVISKMMTSFGYREHDHWTGLTFVGNEICRSKFVDAE